MKIANVLDRQLRAGGCLMALIVALATPCVSWAAEEAHDTAAEAGHHDAGGHGHEPVSTNPLDTDPDLALYTLAIFLILFVVLRKFAWKPIMDALDQREHSIADQISSAERSNAESKQLLAEYQRKLNQAEDEVRTMLDDARRAASSTASEIVAKAQAEAESSKTRALAELDTAKTQAMRELSQHSADLAVRVAGKILRQDLDASRHERLIRDAIGELPGSHN